jgi:drug/metabolite transporter (DMT)-like permease
MVIVSALLHAAWSASIKGSGSPLAFNVLQQGAGALGLLALLPFFVPSEVPGPVWVLLAVTGGVHALYLYFMSRAYEVADLSLVYPLIRSTPALLPLVAVPLLGERITAAGAVGIGVVVAGIWILHAEPGRGLRALLAPGLGFAWLTLLTTVAYSLLDKRAMERLSDAPWTGPAPRSVTFFFLLAAAHAAFFLPLAFTRVGVADLAASWRSGAWKPAAALAASLGSYGLILEAYRTAPASYVVAVRQTSVLFAVGIAALFLAERPDRRRLLGAAATVAGVALIARGG